MKIKEFLEVQKQKRACDIDDLAKRVEELEKINNESNDEEEIKAAGEELDALKAKKAELEKELADINAQLAEVDKPAEGEDGEGQRAKKITKIMNRGANQMNKEEIEQRAKLFKENKGGTFETRSTLISGGTIATPTGVEGINDHFNEVSSIVDMVYVNDCKGMGSNKVAYEVSGSSATAKVEGSAAASSDPTFAFVTITPDSKALLSYVSDQIKKQSPLDYEAKVQKSAKDALRKAAAALITDKVKQSSLVTTVAGPVVSSKGKIDEKTLRRLTLAYGGNENVVGGAVLFLNKTDLVAFGDVRGTQEKKAIYEITPDAANPNTGIIKDGGLAVKYCINSNCIAFDGTTQEANSGADKKTMFYCNPKCIELDLFGDYEIRVSDDYKFAENMLTIRGQVDLGADVVYQDGVVFLTLPKAA